MKPEPTDALLHALLLDGQGGARALEAADIPRRHADGGVLWVHVDLRHDGALETLRDVPGLDARQAALLASEDSRPHAEAMGEAVRLVLRGVNLHPEADPEDMVSLRLWAASGCVASAWRRRLLSVEDVRAALAEGYGPRTAGELIGALAGRLVARVRGTVEGLDERVAAVEEAVADERAPAESSRREIADIRRIAIMLRRYLAPQRDALEHLVAARPAWLGGVARLELHDALDVTTRHIESLDSLRERASVAREELAGQQTALTNRRVYLLSLISAIFLPLSFVTGLLGINVGGLPGADDPRGFVVACAVLVVVALTIVLVFRFGRWM